MLSNKRWDKLRQNYATYKGDGLGKLQGHVFFQSTWHHDTSAAALDLALTCNEAQGVDGAIPQVQPGALDQTFPEKCYDATVISVLLIQLSPRLSFIEFRREAKAKSFDLLQLPWFEEKTSASVAITLATEAPDSRAAQSFRHGKLGSAPCRDTARVPAALAKRKASRSVCRQVVESRDLVKSQEGLKPFLLED